MFKSKKRLIKEYEEELDEYRAKINILYDRIDELENIRKKSNLEDIFNSEYKYAILINKSGKTLFWNEGRYEDSIKTLSLYVSGFRDYEINIEK